MNKVSVKNIGMPLFPENETMKVIHLKKKTQSLLCQSRNKKKVF